MPAVQTWPVRSPGASVQRENEVERRVNPALEQVIPKMGVDAAEIVIFLWCPHLQPIQVFSDHFDWHGHLA